MQLIRYRFAVARFGALAFVVACTRESAPTAAMDAAPSAATVPSAPPSAAAPVVVNDAKITHYKDEAPMNATLAVKHTPATVLTAMPKGDVVAQLKMGDSVTQVAERNGYYRVTFVDPSTATQLLSGWIDKFAFIDRPTPPKKKVPTCSGDQMLVMQGDVRCAKVCSDDAECPGGDCEAAIVLLPSGDPPENHVSTTVCTPKVALAGSATAPAPAKAKPKTTSVGVNVADMSCPNGYMQMQKVSCNKFCKSDDDCGTSEKCKDAGGEKVCY